MIWSQDEQNRCGRCVAAPPVFTTRMERFAALPVNEIAVATLKYERQVWELLRLCDERELLPPMAFCDSIQYRVAAVTDRAAATENLWYIGDLHGDLPALLAAVDYIDGYPAKQAPTIVILGDAYDRFEYGYEVLLTVFHLMLTRPGRVLYLVGNHDVELYYKKRYNVFYPGVMPANFCEWLNRASSERPELSVFGQRLINLMRRMPHALFLPDGTFAAHGGVPHIDVQRGLHTVADLGTIVARQDFVWARFEAKRPHVDPDRVHKDVRLGFQDFDSFCAAASEILGMPVERMIHGHEHPLEQWMIYPHYRSHPILTINTHRISGGGIDQTAVAVARHREGELPEIHLLDLASQINNIE